MAIYPVDSIIQPLNNPVQLAMNNSAISKGEGLAGVKVVTQLGRRLCDAE